MRCRYCGADVRTITEQGSDIVDYIHTNGLYRCLNGPEMADILRFEDYLKELEIAENNHLAQ